MADYLLSANKNLVVIALITAAGFLFRARRFRRKGLFLWDEASYYREALVAAGLLGFYRKHFFELLRLKLRPDAEKRKILVGEFISQKRFDYVWYKVLPLYMSLAALKIFKRRDTAIAAPSLIMGTLAIPVVFLIGRAAFGAGAGLAAACVLAASGLHALQSRSAEPEAGAAASLALAVLFSIIHKTHAQHAGTAYMYSPESIILLALCGFSYCSMGMFNPAWAVIVLPLAIFTETIYAAAAGSIFTGMFLFTVIAILSFICLSMIFFNVPFLLNMWLFPESGIKTTFHRYREWLMSIKSILSRKSEGGGIDGVDLPRTHRLSFYPELFWKTEGVALPLSALGLIFVVCGRHPMGLFLAAHCLAVFGLLTFSPFKAARASTVAIPILCLFAGAMLNALPMWAGAAILMYIAVRGVLYLIRISNLTSGVLRASEFVRDSGESGFLCTSAPFSILYGTDGRPVTVPNSFDAIEFMHRKENYRHIVVEFHENYPGVQSDETLEILQKHFTPVFTAEDPCVTFYPLRAEAEFLSSSWQGVGNVGGFNSEKEMSRWNRYRLKPAERDRSVRVFDLDGFFSSLDSPLVAAEVQVMQANKLFKDENYKDAVALLRKAQVNNPDDPMVKYYLVACYQKLGRAEWALKISREIAGDERLAPDKRDECLGMVLCSEIQSGNPSAKNDAARGLRKLLEKGALPKDQRVRSEEILLYHETAMLMESESYAEAIQMLSAHLAEYPEHSAARFYEAVCHHYLNETDKAAELFKYLLEEKRLGAEFLQVCSDILQKYGM